MGNKLIERMTDAVRAQLDEDLELYRREGLTFTSRDQLRDRLGIGSKRAERLSAWLRAAISSDVEPTTAKSPGRGRVHLVIPDTHAKPGVSLDHFRLLGLLEAHIQPDVTVSLGDWYDLPSMFEGRGQTLKERAGTKLKEDLESGLEAIKLFHRHASTSLVERHFCVGNHDARVYRIGEREPWLADIVDIVDGHEEYGWKVSQFLDPLRIDGVRYQHYLCANGTDKAISGRYSAQRMLERLRFCESVVVGHSHRFDYRTEALPDGRRVHAIVAGCCFEHQEDYAGPDDNGAWWRGAVVLRNVRDGDFDVETWSLERMKLELG